MHHTRGVQSHYVPNNIVGSDILRSRSPSSSRRSTVPPDAKLSKESLSQERGRTESIIRQTNDTMSRENSSHRAKENCSIRSTSEIRPREASLHRYDPNSPNLRKKFSRNSTELLHTAINQNHQFKSALTRSMSSQGLTNHDVDRKKKNIPMLHDQFIPNQPQQQVPHVQQQRPQFVRWNSFKIAEKPSEDLDDRDKSKGITLTVQTSAEQPHTTKDSISPLTVLRDEYNTKRPHTNTVMSTLSNTDNSFQNLVEDSTHSDKVSETGTFIVNSASKASSKVYSRMSQIINIAHGSMHSLIPMLSLKEDETGDTVDSATLGNTMTSGNISNYQSESDDDASDDEYDSEYNSRQDNDIQYKIDSVKSPSMLSSEALSSDNTLHHKDFTDIINEINDFQSNFVDRFNTNAPATPGVKINRTQQKILDYKELHAFEAPPELDIGNSKQASNAKPSFGIPNSYNLKIQHETILSQYTSIRLRFASKISSNSDKVKKQMRTHTGVLGFVNRLHFLNEIEPNEDTWYYKCNNNATNQEDSNENGTEKITFETKDDILKSMWNNELESLFSNNNSSASVDTSFEDAKKDPSSLPLRIEDSNYSEDTNIYNHLTKTINISDLAKSVKLNG
ncbi:uncharacterized protein RJT20DRAFT_64921 [Scheffersomyces xylosifermentans]|uniref:uncharacterized protein n=1 Tax=Scheffersomyces xylosifermentans TaxID=1304137 RepID=UPI00315DCCF7